MEYQLPRPSTLKWNSPEEHKRAARLSRLLLVFSKQAVNALPGIGPVVSGGLEVIQRNADDAEQEKLEQRLQHLVTTTTGLHQDLSQLQDDIKALAALAAVGFLQQAELMTWLRQRDEPAAVDELTSFVLHAAITAYRTRLALGFQYVDHRGIQGGGRAAHITTLPLEEVYVLPRLLPEQVQVELSEQESFTLRQLEDPDLDASERAHLAETYEELTRWRWRQGQGRALPIEQALATLRQAVVLGGPGAGKTTLVRFLARTCALDKQQQQLGWDEQLTPIVISLAEFAAVSTDQPELSIRRFLEERLERNDGPALRAAVGQELGAGRALVLLDGIDEVPSDYPRLRLVRAMDRFLLDHASCRTLVTSRPHGYIRLAGPIPHFYLLNFTKQQVRTFVHKWHRAFERRLHPEAPDQERARSEAQALLDELRQLEKVAELATNPLMLVIVTLIRYEYARLPQERVQLYYRAVTTLLDSWNHGRSLTGSNVGGSTLPVNRLLRVWGKVAAWVRMYKPTGVIHRAELKRKLVQILQDQDLDEDPEATAESYLRAAAEHAGLLEERGPKALAFWHSTFEEFLAAIELTTPSSKAIRRLLPLRDDPRWREVILLAVGHIGIVGHDQETATELVQAIVEESRGPLEPVLHRYLLLAAACVADGANITRRLTEQIITQLATVVHENSYEPFREAFARTIRRRSRLQPRHPETISALIALTNNPHGLIREESTRLLSNIAQSESRARTRCEELLSDGNGTVRFHAALGLIRSDHGHSVAWACLARFVGTMRPIVLDIHQLIEELPYARERLRLLLTDSDPDVRLGASKVLESIDGHDEDPNTLYKLLADNNADVRLRAVLKLLDMGHDGPEVFAALRGLLSEEDPSVRFIAAEMLFDMGLDYSEIMAAVASATVPDAVTTKTEASITPRGTPAETTYSHRSGSTTQPSLGLIHRNPYVQFNTALRLVESGHHGDPKIVAILHSMLSDHDPYVRFSASQALLELNEQPALALMTLATGASEAPSNALVALHKMVLRQQLTAGDGEALATLIRRRPNETVTEAIARRLIFEWLWERAQATLEIEPPPYRGDIPLTVRPVDPDPRQTQYVPSTSPKDISFLDEHGKPTSRSRARIAVVREFNNYGHVVSVMTMRIRN